MPASLVHIPLGSPVLAAVLVSAALTAAAAPGLSVPSKEPGWPQWRGPRRDGISTETNLLQSWHEDGPRVIWSATNLGNGYSSPVISADSIYVTGDVGEELHIFALDLQGGLRWKATNGAAWKNPYPGARACCAISSGRVYHMNGHGRVVCLNAADGALVWQADTIEAFESRVPTWGMAECLLVFDNQVIVTPGGRKAAMAALDKSSGKVLWTSPSLEPKPTAGTAPRRVEGPAYASPILIQVFGRRVIAGVTARHFIGVDARTGELEWSFEMPTTHEVLASSPTLCPEGVFVTGPDGGGGRLLRFRSDGKGVDPAWTTSLDTCHGGVVALDGFLYGSWYRSFNGWGAVDLRDGSVPFRSRELPMGSLLYADGRLYCLAQNGIMTLVEPIPSAWKVVSRFTFADGRRNDVWAHPVILDARLYLRHHDVLRCYDILRGNTDSRL